MTGKLDGYRMFAASSWVKIGSKEIERGYGFFERRKAAKSVLIASSNCVIT